MVLRIFHMNLVGSYCILAVLMVRLLLKRQPQIFSYVLWSLVWFRLACPVSSYNLRKKLQILKLKDGYAIVPQLETPLVFGTIHPRIYLSSELTSEEIPYILEHERVHIRRRDYLVKPLAFLLLCIHWFNPLVWLVFFCMDKDMEMSCDEAVLKKLGHKIKRDYSTSLLSLACDRTFFNGGPLAFGEQGVKKRIKNVLRYKKPRILGIVLTISVITLSFLTLLSDPASTDKKEETPIKEAAVLPSPKPANPKPVQTARPTTKPVSSQMPESDRPEIHYPDIEDLTFSDLDGIEFWHGSGVGAWRTILFIKADGSFSGYYKAGDTSSNYLYPRGTSYIHYFNGQFSDLKKTGPYEYSMKCKDVKIEIKK